MDEKIVRFEELLAGALLKFESVDKVDIALLIEGLTQDDSIKYIDTELPFIREYVDIKNGVWSLKESLKLESNIWEPYDKIFTLKQKLENEQGEIVSLHLKSLDLTDFILKKIKYLGEIDINDINKLFNKEEREIINQLFEKEYITTIWNDDIPHLDFEEIIITQKGELYLFKNKNERNIDKFIVQLRKLGCDTKLIDDFLMMQNLESNPFEILNIYNFLDFCETYDRCSYSLNSSVELNYIKLNYDEESIKLLETLLSLGDNNHKVGVCHPNNLFNDFSEYRELDNWEDINIKKMLDTGDFEVLCSATCMGAIKGICDSLNLIESTKSHEKNDEIKYLVVIERFLFNDDYNYLIRGIIKGNHEGCSLAFNPEYENSLPARQRSLLNSSQK